MSLRLRFFLAFCLLLGVLAAFAAYGLLALRADVDRALEDTALRVGTSVITVLRAGSEPAAPLDAAVGRRVELRRQADGPTQMRMFVDGRELSPDEVDEAMAEHPGDLPRIEDGALAIEGGALAVGGGPAPLRLRGGGFDELIPLPGGGAREALRRYSTRMSWGLAALLLAGLLLAAWMAQRIGAPLRELSAAARRVAAGELGTQAPERGPPELRDTVAAFNRMSGELAALDAEARRLRERQALAELGEVGRGLAHALRNPLHAVGLAVDELAAGTDAARAPRLARDARAQLARVDQSLRGFLALAAGEAARSAPVDLRDVAADVLLEASQRHDTAARARLLPGPPVVIDGVAAELRILLHTLVVNALEASGAGGEVTVDVRGGDPVCVDVRDHGSGVAPELRGRLFAPHVSSKPDGAGMGLYLAQRLAALRYGGRITLHDAQPGTLARLELGDRRA